jgi:hypothetical protein
MCLWCATIAVLPGNLATFCPANKTIVNNKTVISQQDIVECYRNQIKKQCSKLLEVWRQAEAKKDKAKAFTILYIFLGIGIVGALAGKRYINQSIAACTPGLGNSVGLCSLCSGAPNQWLGYTGAAGEEILSIVHSVFHSADSMITSGAKMVGNTIPGTDFSELVEKPGHVKAVVTTFIGLMVTAF